MPEMGNDDAQGAAPGGSADERSDMLAIAPSTEDRGVLFNEYATAVTACVRARRAAAEIKAAHKVFSDAMETIADSMAPMVGKSDSVRSWDEVAVMNTEEVWFLEALAVGRKADWLRKEGYAETSPEGVPEDVYELEGLIRATINAEGFTSAEDVAALNALWSADPAEQTVAVAPADYIETWLESVYPDGNVRVPLARKTLAEISRALHAIDEFMVVPIRDAIKSAVADYGDQAHGLIPEDQRIFDDADVGRLIFWTDELRKDCAYLLESISDVVLLAHEDVHSIAAGYMPDGSTLEDTRFKKHLRRFYGLDRLDW
jgi:hypothetical protein